MNNDDNFVPEDDFDDEIPEIETEHDTSFDPAIFGKVRKLDRDLVKSVGTMGREWTINCDFNITAEWTIGSLVFRVDKSIDLCYRYSGLIRRINEQKSVLNCGLKENAAAIGKGV